MKYTIKKALKALGLYNVMCRTFLPKRKFIVEPFVYIDKRDGIAHTYQKGYGWSDYSESNYIIEKISRKEIVGRSERYSHEGIRISREDLDSGRFELRL